MSKFTKPAALLTVSALLAALCACGGAGEAESPAVSAAATATAAAAASPESAAPESPEAAPETPAQATPESQAPESTPPVSEAPDNGAAEALKVDGVGDYNWQLSVDGSYWYLTDLCYVSQPVDMDYQTMSIYVPSAYLKSGEDGKVAYTDETVYGFSADTAPILYLCEAPGYSENKASSRPDNTALQNGFIAVSPGHRGKGTSTTGENGETYYDGKSPWCLIDLKACIRYLRCNDEALPGSADRIISSASSGGGAMSSFLACTANDPVYDDYLFEAGAVLTVGDEIFAANCYCPITNVANSDTAYEWFLGSEAHLENLGSSALQKALSGYLSDAFVDYLAGLGYSEAEFEKTLTDQIAWSANYYLQEVMNGVVTLTWNEDAQFAHPETPTMAEIAQNYIAGRYTKAGQKGKTIAGADISAWLSWDEASQSCVITSLAAFEDDYGRMKKVTSFDGLNGTATENKPFGDRDEDYKHFSNAVLDVLTAHYDELEALWSEADAEYTGQASFKALYDDFKSDVAEGDSDAYGNDIVDLYNPMLFIDKDTAYLNGDKAQYVRIRMGTADSNTSLAITTLLDMALEDAGVSVDMEYVWQGGHGVVEQKNGSLYEWINEIVGQMN